MKTKPYKRFYWLSLAVILALSAYPVIHGVRMLALSIVSGALEPEQLRRYVVPYAAICAALLLFAALQPVVLRLRGRWVFPASTALTYGVFFAMGQALENIRINNANGLASIRGAHPAPRLDMWQALSCYISPEAVKAAQLQEQAFIGENGFYNVVGNSAYKAHYYLISLVLITMACGLVYGIGRALQEGDSKKQTHILQGASLGVLIAICAFANLTGFFRTTASIQTPLASMLTALFFVLLGAAAGIYAGSFMLGKKRGLWLPICAAMLVTILMYVGEVAMMDGGLYRFGTGWFFAGLPVIPLAPVDILVVLMSGAVTWLALWLVRIDGA